MNIVEKKYNLNGVLKKRSKTDTIILHHASAKSCTPEQVDSWHKQRGWTCIGYHFLVRKDGTIYRGRPEDVIGAHASNHNSTSIGICAEGNFEIETMPEVQKRALIELVSYLKKKYNITKVLRHKDIGSTDCPGKNYPFEEIANGTNNSKYSAGQAVEVLIPVALTGAKENNDVMVDSNGYQFWVHKTVIKDGKIIARATICFASGNKYIIQIFNRQFWCDERYIVKKL